MYCFSRPTEEKLELYQELGVERTVDGVAGSDSSSPRSDYMYYHMVMARREVLVQLDDELIERLAAIADAEGTSRSALLRRGARAVIEATDLAAADAGLVAAYRRRPQDPALVQAAGRLAAETMPPW